jgi:CSLREA domain-containing protein
VLFASAAALMLPSFAAAATISVNTTNDEFGTGPRCSLREAIWSANNNSNAQAPGCAAGSGLDVVKVPGGFFSLSRSAAAPPAQTLENGNLYGDLDITAPVTITHGGIRPAVIADGVGDHVLQNFSDGVVLRGLTITSGSASSGPGASGGGIKNQGQILIQNSTISYNRATSGGGLASEGGSSVLELVNSTVFGNIANEDGGGIYAEGGATVLLRSTTVSGNRVRSGDGAGVFAFSSSGLRLRNTLLAGNDDDGAEAHDCARTGGSSITSLGHNLVGNTNGCNYRQGSRDILNRSAQVIELGDFGGPTQTVNLKKTSPAINRGARCPGTDQRGVPRSMGGPCDIGAWELVRCEGVVVNLIGTNGPELLVGTSGPDGVLALGGQDAVRASDGKDGLCGGAGNDLLKGAGGDDRINGGPGRDTCIGGGGRDRIRNCELSKADQAARGVIAVWR